MTLPKRSVFEGRRAAVRAVVLTACMIPAVCLPTLGAERTVLCEEFTKLT